MVARVVVVGACVVVVDEDEDEDEDETMLEDEAVVEEAEDELGVAAGDEAVEAALEPGADELLLTCAVDETVELALGTTTTVEDEAMMLEDAAEEEADEATTAEELARTEDDADAALETTVDDTIAEDAAADDTTVEEAEIVLEAEGRTDEDAAVGTLELDAFVADADAETAVDETTTEEDVADDETTAEDEATAAGRPTTGTGLVNAALETL